MRFRTAACLLSLGLAACAAESPGGDPVNDDVDLTSLTARQRTLAFEGVVYAEPDSSDDAILELARAQARSAFGALLHYEVSVQTREVQNVDAKSFKKRSVTVVDPNVAGDAGHEMVEVKYTYRDNAVVPLKMATKTALNIALISAGGEEKTKDIVAACTKNDHEAQEDAEAGLLWYDFDPSRSTCRKAIETEAKTIEADSGQLTDKKTMVSASRVNRVYLPANVALSASDNATKPTYPEYDRLFAGASEEGVLTIALVNGRLAHKKVEARKDDGYYEWLSALDVVFTEHPDFELTKIEPQEELTYAYAEGKKYENLKITDVINWQVYGRGWPQGMPASSRDNIAKTIADKLDNHWLTFEKKVKVQIGRKPAQDLTIRLETLFGVDDDTAPHRHALTHGDVVIYNGHSYIGEGPLDPGNYKRESFKKGYQIFWFDSCVSYNYYEKDFFVLKEGGSKNLDLVVNGIEAPEWKSGEANGKFIAKMIDGSNPSYNALLAEAKATDALRVVDGEIDNKWTAAKTPIVFSK